MSFRSAEDRRAALAALLGALVGVGFMLVPHNVTMTVPFGGPVTRSCGLPVLNLDHDLSKCSTVNHQYLTTGLIVLVLACIGGVATALILRSGRPRA